MATISWNENLPDGDQSLGIGDDDARSTKTAIRSAMDTEHVWPAGGGDAGVHRLGSGRPYVGIQSTVSSSGSDGRLMWASDTSQFFHVGSGGTAFLGGPRVISAGSYPGSAPPQRYQWVDEFGEGKTVSGSTVLTFPNSGYSGKPYVQVTNYEQGAVAAQIMYIVSCTATQMTVKSSATNGLGNSSTSFFWRSVGTRVL